MAQVELRFFGQAIEADARRELCELVQTTVFGVHYPEMVDSRQARHGVIMLHPGDITLSVPILDIELSSSDADYELEISEGADNWPKDKNGVHLMGKSAEEVLQARAERISTALVSLYAGFSHNVFEVSAYGTGWAQYKPGTID